MPDRHLSRTAEFATLFRAAHRTFDGLPRIFDDPLALEMLEPGSRLVLQVPGMFRLLQMLKPMRPARAQVLVRARWAEDRLDRALARGVGQYVMLGAGFDSFALRRGAEAPSLRIFELDHPDNQAVKRRKLARLCPEIPPNLEFVPFDLETGSVTVALQGAGYSPVRPAFFSWLGVVHYLTEAAVRTTLYRLRACAAPGSELVLDYGLDDDELSDADRLLKESVEIEARLRGEPMHSFFTAARIRELAEEEGWRVVENVTPAQQRERYLRGRGDKLDVLGMFSLLALEVPAGSPAATACASSRSRTP